MPRPARPSLGIALIGCGAAARQYHLRALLSDPAVNLVAVADPSPEALSTPILPPETARFEDAEPALSDERVEAVVIAASTPAHEGLAMAAIAAGRHVYLEKPVALSREGAARLARAAALSSKLCAVGFNYRLNPAFAQLRARVCADEIGRIHRIHASFCEPGARAQHGWRADPLSGGGVLFDLASHEIDTLRWVTGAEISSIRSCETRSILTPDDEASFALTLAGGIDVSARASYRSGREHRWQLEGERGSLRLDRWPARVSSRRRGVVANLERRLRDSPTPRREPSFRLALAEFVRGAMGEQGGLPTIEDGARSLDAVLSLTELARTGGGS